MEVGAVLETGEFDELNSNPEFLKWLMGIRMNKQPL